MRKVQLTVKNMLRYKSFGYFFKLIKLIIYFIKVDKNCHKWLVLDLSNSYTITVTIVLLIFAGINFREVGKKNSSRHGYFVVDVVKEV